MSCANWFSLFVGLPHGAYAYASLRTCMHLRITCRSNTTAASFHAILIKILPLEGRGQGSSVFDVVNEEDNIGDGK